MMYLFALVLICSPLADIPRAEVHQLTCLVVHHFPPGERMTALAVAWGESRHNPSARNDSRPWREQSYGYFQININAHDITEEQALDPEFNVRFAAELWRQYGWSPWLIMSRKLGVR